MHVFGYLIHLILLLQFNTKNQNIVALFLSAWKVPKLTPVIIGMIRESNVIMSCINHRGTSNFQVKKSKW